MIGNVFDLPLWPGLDADLFPPGMWWNPFARWFNQF